MSETETNLEDAGDWEEATKTAPLISSFRVSMKSSIGSALGRFGGGASSCQYQSALPFSPPSQ
jgi:hypothetical protein